MHRHYTINTRGTDYVVGDIHGHFTLLQNTLNKLGFSEETDRLFSVGDLVDRGEESHLALDWLEKPWFHPVLANHEKMVIDSFEQGGQYTQLHAMNGGLWFYTLSPKIQEIYVKAFNKLPLTITVDTLGGKVGIIHAEVFKGDWEATQGLMVDGVEETALWSRTKIQSKNTDNIKNIHKVYSGHTSITEILTLGNQTYIDTGAYSGWEKLTVVAIGD